MPTFAHEAFTKCKAPQKGTLPCREFLEQHSRQGSVPFCGMLRNKTRFMDIVGNALPLLTYQDIGYSFDAVGNVLGYENKAAGYETAQKYTYDGLYQLVKAEGDSIGRSGAGTGLYDYETHYEQAFSFDMIGNMTEKKSRTRSPYANPPGVNLDYESQYTYKKGTHQAIQIGSARYEYDGNGNVILERYGNADTPTGNKRTHEVHEEDGVYSTDYGFALTLGSAGSGSTNTERRYVWNERNLLKRSSDGQYAVEYRYGADGQRAIKYAVKQGGSGERTETLYYNKWYQLVSTNDNLRMVESKHIYVGETRIATKQRHDDNSNYSEELKHTYYYHGDHLGSAQVVTNGSGEIYEHIEYTPYGELWVDHTKRIGSEEGTPFRFTGKEYDEETGLYYYGARYLDPKTSRWISTDPAMAEYIPGAPINDEAKKRNQNLPGMGGVFNYVNLHVYHYAGNNPVKLIDPDGRESGYVRRKDAVGYQGHAGVFAKRSDGKYIFTEIIPIKDADENYSVETITKEENLNDGAFPISAFNENDIGAVQYEFDNIEEMKAFFRDNEFTDYIEFNTSPEQDAAIIAAATLLGENFTDYMIPGNHCGIFAERALDAGGKGIKTRAETRNVETAIALRMAKWSSSFLAYARWLQAPNSIGDDLRQKNNGKVVKIE